MKNILHRISAVCCLLPIAILSLILLLNFVDLGLVVDDVFSDGVLGMFMYGFVYIVPIFSAPIFVFTTSIYNQAILVQRVLFTLGYLFILFFIAVGLFASAVSLNGVGGMVVVVFFYIPFLISVTVCAISVVGLFITELYYLHYS